jgi:hypothetical protein
VKDDLPPSCASELRSTAAATRGDPWIAGGTHLDHAGWVEVVGLVQAMNAVAAIRAIERASEQKRMHDAPRGPKTRLSGVLLFL